MTKKILILGAPASGKTTLARKIANTYSIHHIEVDLLYWKNQKGGLVNPNFVKDLENVTNSLNEWVIEGLFKVSYPIIKGQITHIIILRSPYHSLLKRSLIRFLHGGTIMDLLINLNPISFLRRRKVYKMLKKSGLREFQYLKS